MLYEVITLVGHSYGGMIVTGVADSIPDRIDKLVYLDAVYPNVITSYSIHYTKLYEERWLPITKPLDVSTWTVFHQPDVVHHKLR